MKKILAIALTLTLVFALCLSASAALPAGWVTVNGTTDDQHKINADGSLSMYWGDPAIGANLTVGYDVSAFNNNYTATVEAYLPEKTILNGAFVTGANVVSVKATDPANGMWLYGYALKVINYEGHPAGTPDNFAAWGGTYCVIEGFDNLNPLAAACASYADLNIKAGDWNTIKVVVEGNKVSYYVNGALASTSDSVASSGNFFCLANNGDGGNPAFKNLVIKSNNGSVADVTAFTVTTAGPADIEVVAIAGAMIIALMAAAFVVKARKA